LLALGTVLFTACGSDDWEEGEYDENGEESDYDEEEAEEEQAAVEQRPPLREAVAPTPLPPGAEFALTKWDLWSSGTTTLRGANIHQRLVYPELDGTEYMGPGPVGPPFTQQDFDDLSALGANWVNISHPGLFTEEPPFQVNPDAEANLDALLAMIEQADMFAVISFRTGPGRSEFTFFDYELWFPESYRIETVWDDQAAQDAWVAMWQHTAERYKDNPVVVGYDLMVEPNADFVCCHIEGEPQQFYPEHAGAIYDWNRFYPRIVEGIRGIDANTPIIVGGMGMSAVVYLPYIEPTDDPRMVYAFHQYEPVDYTHQEPGPLGGLSKEYPDEYDTNWDNEPDTVDIGWLDALLWPVDDFVAEHGVPVTSNEFGPIRYEPGAAQFMDDQMAVFEARGMNHAMWEWGPAFPPLREDQQDFAFRLGTDFDEYTEDKPSDLQDVIVSYWAWNGYRPSNVTFVPVE
jgi:hypothetical protein